MRDLTFYTLSGHNQEMVLELEASDIPDVT